MKCHRVLGSLAVIVVIAAGCSSDGDASPGPDGDPSGRSGRPEADPGLTAERIDGGELQGDGDVTIDDLVSSDDLPPTAVGSRTAGDGSGVRPLVWELGDDETWTRSEPETPSGGDGYLHDVTGWDGGGLAVGVDVADGRPRAWAWTGSDGAWSPAEQPLTDEEGSSGALDVASYDGRVVAIGYVDPPGDEPAATRNRAWVGDGERWAPADLPGMDETGTSLYDVAVGEGGTVVVGSRAEGDVTQAVAWHSADGEDWAEVDLGGGDGSWAEAVVAVGPGFVAGGAATPQAVPARAVWRSDDGATWARGADPVPWEADVISSSRTSVTALAARGGRVFASGFGRDELWVSTDGAAWDAWPDRLSAVPEYGVAPRASDVALRADGTPIVVVTEGPNILVPADGAWVEAPGAADVLPLDARGVQVDGVVVHDGRVVLYGATSVPDRPGRSSPTEATFWERHGAGWEAASPPSLHDRGVQAMASTDLGLMGVGYREYQPQVPSSDEALVTIQRDGEEWERVAGADEDVARSLHDIDRWRGGWLAVGTRLVPDPSFPDGAVDARVALRGNPTTGAGRAIPVDLGPLATPPGTSESLTALCTGPSGVVVIGSGSGPSGRREPLVASAPDVDGGWVEATADDGFAAGREGAGLSDCTVDGRGEILLHGAVQASDGRNEPLAWRSTDGVSWARLRSDAWGGAGAQSVAAVVALDEGWLAVGSESLEGQEDDAALWLVRADDTVVRVPLDGDLVGPGAQALVDVAVQGDEVVLVGEVDTVPAVWTVALDDVRAAADG